MKHSLIFTLVILCSACTSFAQRTVKDVLPRSSTTSQAIEGQALRHQGANYTILGNIEVSRMDSEQGASNDTSKAKPLTAARAAGATDVMKRIGGYTISRSVQDKARAQSAEALTTTSAGTKIVSVTPTAIVGDAAFIGVAYDNNTGDMGLIGKEIVLKFKDKGIPSHYQSLDLRELVPNSGLYILIVKDIQDWLSRLPALEADPRIALVEAQIKMNFESNK